MATFFVYGDEKFDDHVPLKLSVKESHHVFRVLRATERDRLVLFDGHGRIADANLVNFEGNTATVLPKNVVQKPEQQPQILLLQGILKPPAMDLLIRQATELGVAGIFPVACEFSTVKTDKDHDRRRLDRWQTIALEACKQSKNPFLPKIYDCKKLANVKEMLPLETLVVVASLREGALPWNHFQATLSKTKPQVIALVVGPEGDFSSDEYAQLAAMNAIHISLGSRILTSETAALALLSASQLMT